MSQLADLLERSRAALVRPGDAAAPFEALLATLRRGALAPHDGPVDGGDVPDEGDAQLDALHDRVFALVEDHAPTVAPRELRLVSEWRHRVAQANQRARAAHLDDANRRLQSEYCQRSANLRTALAHANICVFEQDTELAFKWVYNELLSDGERLLGNPPALAADKQRALAGERTRSELPITVGGETRHLVVIHEPVRDGDGVISGIVGTTIDVTEEKRVQAELAQTLVFREKMLAVLGHDLRNPLGAILGIVGLARLEGDLTPRARSHVEQVENAARRMLELIGTLLDFTKTRFAGRLPLAPAATDLGELVARVVDELAVAHPATTIDLETRGDLRGQWDPGRLAQVVSNLVGNAIAHGEARAAVRLRLDGDGDGDEVRLTVHNHGPAIAPELLPVVFEPFREGAHADATPPQGLGLGLYIAREIVLAHGGEISVQSSAREGTTFLVRLPRHA